MLDIDLLRSFVSVVDAGGFTRAGERVHRTQSTVSQQIKRLEDTFGRPLLHRNGKRVAPTEEGERLLLHLSRGVADWPETTFDMVSLIDVMHHVRLDLRRPILDAAIARVKPGGILLYKDMCRRPRWRALLNWCQDLVVSRQWIRYIPISQVEDVARSAELVELRSETIYRLGFGHELRVYRRPG